MKRLCIYFFFDKEGIVDDYVFYFLKSIKPFCNEICMVINGNININYSSKLNEYCDNILIRDNYGLDAWAYKYALEYYGFEQLKEYDEVICTNFTFFGPFYPLAELFNTMDCKPCDWWGLHKWWTPFVVEYDHIPSYFIAYRKSMLASEHFKNYWQTLKKISSYEESVEFHEQRQTPYYDNLGFRSAVYMENHEYSAIERFWWPLKLADRPIREKRFPFIKRRCFTTPEEGFIDAAANTINYITYHKLYNKKMISDNIIRTTSSKYIHNIQYYKRKILSYLHPISKQRKRNRSLAKTYDKHKSYINKLFNNTITNNTITNNTITKLPVPDVEYVGKCTYCNDDIFIASKKTKIGSFCSIGMRVVLGHGEHPIEMLTTSPFLYLDALGYKNVNMISHNNFLYIHPITIGNDVWIGDGVFVKNGVTIGDGSIIGARAVVTKDVPPYAIVIGAPARLYRWRFSEAIRNELLELKWWELDDEVIKNIPYDNMDEALQFLRAIRKSI